MSIPDDVSETETVRKLKSERDQYLRAVTASLEISLEALKSRTDAQNQAKVWYEEYLSSLEKISAIRSSVRDLFAAEEAVVAADREVSHFFESGIPASSEDALRAAQEEHLRAVYRLREVRKTFRSLLEGSGLLAEEPQKTEPSTSKGETPYATAEELEELKDAGWTETNFESLPPPWKHPVLEPVFPLREAVRMARAYNRGRNDATLDDVEAKFESIGGLEARTRPTVPEYVSETDHSEWLRGYFSACEEIYGADWRTREFRWVPVLDVPGQS